MHMFNNFPEDLKAQSFIIFGQILHQHKERFYLFIGPLQWNLFLQKSWISTS